MSHINANPARTPSRDAQHASPPEDGAIKRLRSKINRLCLQARLILLARASLLTLGTLGLSIITLAFIDYLLRLPMPIRLASLVGILVLVYRLWTSTILPAWRLAITRSLIALRIEQQDQSLKGLLTSSIDLLDPDSAPDLHPQDPIEHALRLASIRLASRRLDAHRLPSILAWNHLLTSIALACIPIALFVGISIQSPHLLSIGATRTLTPWVSLAWPKRYPITDTTNLAAYPNDVAIPIRAQVGLGGSLNPSVAGATVRWRILDEHNTPITAWQTDLLTAQHSLAPSIDSNAHELVFERLITPPTIAIAGNDNPTRSLQYRLTTDDDQSPLQTIALIPPPKLLTTTIAIDLPTYAQPIADRDTPIVGQRTITVSEESIAPVLAGSSLTITWSFSKPIDFTPPQLPQWITSLIDQHAIAPNPTLIQPTENTIVLSAIADEPMTIEPGIHDLAGIAVRDPIRLHLGVISDLDPEASIITPADDELLSPQAKIELGAEFIDDLGLKRARIQAQLVPGLVANSTQSSSDTENENEIESTAAPTLVIDATLNADRRSTQTTTLSIPDLNAKPGDEIHIIATAMDLRASTESSRDQSLPIGTAHSRVRVLRIVAPSEIVDQIRASLPPITTALRRLDRDQTTLQSRLRDHQQSDPTNHANPADQRRLSEQLRRLTQSFEHLSTTLSRNAIDDQSLTDLLTQTTAAADAASTSSDRAARQIEQGDTDQALDTQRIVRDHLTDLLTMLDRGQDAWLAVRSIEQLRENLVSIKSQTDEFTAQAAGKSLDQLTQDQRSTLERILDQQLNTALDAQSMLTTLDQRAEALAEHDPAQAQALRQAAEQARRAEIEQQLNQAADNIADNQTSSASSTQSQVIDELDEMLEDLEHAINDRDNRLRRELASLMESLKQLITQQRTEINRADDPQAIDSMLTLVGNTLAVRDQALGQFPEIKSIAQEIEQAARSQQHAIESLREQPKAIAQVINHERSSLHHLELALQQAEELDQQAADRQAQQQRAKLRDAYRQSLQSQIDLRDQTRVLGNEPLNRRLRAQARALANAQRTIGQELTTLLDETDELADAPMFALAHRQLDTHIQASATGLSERSITPRVGLSQQAAIDLLTMLVEVLDDTQDQTPQDFDDGSQGGSGDGSGSGNEPVIPPVAQLKLLRSMQNLAAMQTKLFADDPASTNPDDLNALSDLQNQLFEHAEQLIEQLNSSPQPKPTPNAAPDSTPEETP
ncbi:MAG: hypothetical protein ACWA5W_10120 [Phycisphaerales bacterium]